MNKKYIMFIFTLFLGFNIIDVNAHTKSAQFLESKDGKSGPLTITFEDPNFCVVVNSVNGEITGWSLPEKDYKKLTEEEKYYILIDAAEIVFGKESERYELNKEKFMTMIEELKQTE